MSDYAILVPLALLPLYGAVLLLSSVLATEWRIRRLVWRRRALNRIRDAAHGMLRGPPTSERADTILRLLRVRAPPLTVLLVAALLPAIARADPPPCTESRPGWRECPVERLAQIQATEAALWDALAEDRAALAVARQEASEARARAERLDRELRAERDAAALRVCPQVDVVPWALAGAGVGAAIVAVLGLLVGGR